MSTLRKRLGGNFSANIYAQLVSMAYTLLTIPIFLSVWNIELYGEWLIISALPSYISLSNMGLMNVAQNNMTMAMGKGLVNSAKISLHTIWGCQLVLNILIFSLVMTLLNIVNFVEFFHLKHIAYDDANYTILALSVFALLNLQIGIFGGIYRAVGRNARGIYMINTTRLLCILAVAISLFIGVSNVVAISSIMTTICFVGFICIYYDSTKIAPELRPGLELFDLKELKSSIRLGLAFMSYPLGRAITNQGMLIFTNAYMGATSVVVLSTLRTVVNVAFQISNLINLSTWPEFSRLYGAKDYNGVKRLFAFSTSMGFWSGVLCASSLLILGPLLLEVWTNGGVIVGRQLLIVYLSAIVINSVWYTALTIFNATNRHGRISIYYLISSIFVPIIAWISYKLFNLELYSVGVGFIFMETSMLIYVLPKALELLSINKKDWIINIINYPAFILRSKLKSYI